MVIIGADSHKRTHTFVAVDDVGKRLASGRWLPPPKGISRPRMGRALA